MYGVHLFFITLPGAVLAIGATFWVIRFEAKRRYCFYKLNQDGTQKDPFAGERTDPMLKQEKHALFIMLGIAGRVELEPNSYFTGWKVLQLSLSFVIAICLAYTGLVAVNKEG